jgi:CRISPR/Cas system CSM-associated protein Csm3 (group 7 of RAMP superfamily)
MWFQRQEAIITMAEQMLRIACQINVATPFHVGTGNSAGLTQRTVVRDARGYLILPGSGLKGALRARVEQLCNLWGLAACNSQYGGRECFGPEPCLVCRLFGSRFQGQRLFCSDARLEDEYQELFKWDITGLPFGQTQNRTQIKISRLRGVAQEQHLFESEYGQAGLSFQAVISGKIDSGTILLQNGAAEVFPEVALVLAGLRLIDHLGGGESCGFGKVDIEISSLILNSQPLEVKNQFKYLGDAIHSLKERGRSA